MKDVVLKFGLMSFLLAVTVAGTPVALRAQATNAVLPGLIKINKDQVPFRGKLSAVDTNANTITVNNQTIQITTNTIVTRQAKRVRLADGTPGESVAGTFKKEADGKLKALDLRFAPKHLTQPTNTTTKAATP
jgi:hypothetical protein